MADLVDDEQIEAAIRAASTAFSQSSRKRRVMESATDVLEEHAHEHVNWNRALDRQSNGRRLPNWGKSANAGASSSQTIDVVDIGREAIGDRQWPAFSPPSCRQADYKMKYPLMSFGGRIVYARTYLEVEKAASELTKIVKAKKEGAHRIPLGFDIEWKPTFVKGEPPTKAAVMQICVDTNHCFVMHIFHSGIPPTLRAFLADSSFIKVGVAIAGDAAKIMRDYNTEVSPWHDLSEFANLKLGCPPKQWGLSSLTETIACKQLAKPPRIRMGNWEAKVLTEPQVHYAATDAFASWFLYEALKSFPERISRDGDAQPYK
ncbi:3'-5' exonuclease-like [Wolffia australiana]